MIMTKPSGSNAKKLAEAKKDIVKTWNEDAVRFPKPIATNNIVLQDKFSEDATLVRDILVYMAMNMKRNIFGPYTQITIAEFGKAMGYEPSNLSRRRKFTDNPPQIGDHVLDGYFDYILYMMQATPIMNDSLFKGKYSRTAFLMIQKLEVFRGPRGKLIYDIRLPEEIVDSILQEYFVISLKDYVTAGKLNKRDSQAVGQARNLYLFLIQGVHLARHQKEKGMPACFETTVDVISKAIGLKMSREGTDRKFYINKLLEKLSNKLDHMKFTYQFFGEKSKYHLRFIYSDETMERYEKETERKMFTMLYKTLLESFTRTYKSKTWFTDDSKMSAFHGWLTKHEHDYNIKRSVFNDCIKKVYNIEYEDVDDEWANAMLKDGFSAMIEKYRLTEKSAVPSGNL